MTEQTVYELYGKTYHERLEKAILLDWFIQKMKETTPMSRLREAAITTLISSYDEIKTR